MHYPENRKPAPSKKCPYCKKIVAARGLVSHMRLSHPNEPIKASNAETITGWKTSKEQRKKILDNKEASVKLHELIVMYGLAWVLKEIAKMDANERANLFKIG